MNDSMSVPLKPNRLALAPAAPTCPHHVTYFQKAGNYAELQKWRVCGKPATARGGWCAEHAYGQDILNTARRFGCAALELSPERSIARGLANWRGYAETVSRRIWERDRVTVQNAAARFEFECKAALKRAIERCAAAARGVDVDETELAQVEQAIEQAAPAWDVWGSVPLKRAVAVPARAAVAVLDAESDESVLEGAVF